MFICYPYTLLACFWALPSLEKSCTCDWKHAPTPTGAVIGQRPKHVEALYTITFGTVSAVCEIEILFFIGAILYAAENATQVALDAIQCLGEW